MLFLPDGKKRKILSSSFHQVEERICELEDRNFEIIHSEQNKEKRMQKSE